jgi:hypothetical protein
MKTAQGTDQHDVSRHLAVSAKVLHLAGGFLQLSDRGGRQQNNASLMLIKT